VVSPSTDRELHIDPLSVTDQGADIQCNSLCNLSRDAIARCTKYLVYHESQQIVASYIAAIVSYNSLRIQYILVSAMNEIKHVYGASCCV
jgi:hypothetical protein